MGDLVLAGGTSGTITLTPTAVAGSNTLTLPASTGTVLTNKTVGTVLQVVSTAYSTATSNSTSTYADTGLTATITPTSNTSKILVLVGQTTVQIQSSNTGAGFRLRRDSTTLCTFGFYVGYTSASPAYYDGGVPLSYLDSPASTSALTYKVQFISESNSASVTVQPNDTTSTITLMEIAA